MTAPRFRDLTFDELQGRGWQVQTSRDVHRYGGVYVCTLVLPNQHGAVIHAVTGQGRTNDEARTKAVEIANLWRRVQAKKRSRDEGQTNQ